MWCAMNRDCLKCTCFRQVAQLCHLTAPCFLSSLSGSRFMGIAEQMGRTLQVCQKYPANSVSLSAVLLTLDGFMISDSPVASCTW